MNPSTLSPQFLSLEGVYPDETCLIGDPPVTRSGHEGGFCKGLSTSLPLLGGKSSSGPTHDIYKCCCR
jgi:hypothetical protein